MFKLQRLEITGFKSFADYTEIVFTGNGITAVVGPNGCGKSNVSESIAWVLGEQRAKALRGSEMKDVVFQGTRTRKPGGMAEVVLHLVRDEESFFVADEEDLTGIDEALGSLDESAVDMEEIESLTVVAGSEEPVGIVPHEVSENGSNGHHPQAVVEIEAGEAAEAGETDETALLQAAEKKLRTKRHWRPRSFALDFAPGESISVTRRLYLSGESEYLLNGKACRLRDIQDLFAGTGLSGAHYAIIEQGRIGQILSAKPSDRRSLIEEAAGISKFRTRQRAAEARLESAKSNLSRITDIVTEIEKQANALRRQASRTKRYKILREEFRVLLKQLFAAEGRHFTELVAELDRKLTEAVRSERNLFSEVTAKDEAFRKATQAAREAEEKLAEIRSRHAEAALERDRNAREKVYRREQIEGLTGRAAVLKGEIEATADRLEVFKSEIERLKKDEEREQAEAGKAEAALREAEKAHQAKVDELRGIEDELERERAEVLQHTAGVERFAELERQLEHNAERLTERVEGLRREGVRAEESLIDHAKEAARLASELLEKRERHAGFVVEKQDLLAATAGARALLLSSEKALAELRNEFSGKHHRLETLQELDQKRAIYAPAVQKLFAEQEKIGVRFIGTLAERLNVDVKAERAVENLLGAYLQTVLVESAEAAAKVTAWLKANNAGRIAVLVAGEPGAKTGPSKKAASKIVDLLGVDNAIADLLTEVFPREMGAELVGDLETAAAKTGASYVDAEGDFVLSGKLFVSGKAGANDKGSSLLAFRREMRELEAALADIGGRIEKAEEETVAARQALIEKEEEIVDLQSLIVHIEREILGLEIQEKSARQETERAERHKKVVSDETAQIEREIREIGTRLEEARISAARAEAARMRASESLAAISTRLGEMRALMESDNAVLNQKRTLAATSEERRRAAQNALRRVEAEFRDLESRHQRQKAELRETEGKQKSLSDSIAEIERRIASAASEQSQEQNELSAATEHLKEAREAADAMSAELAELNKASADARNERAGLEIRKAESVTELRNLNEKCSQELNISLVDLVEREEIEDGFELDDARAQAADLRERIESFGGINMLALEELAETEERLLFLTSQRQDIIDSIATAEEALREIKSRSRERFRQAFEAINENFKEFFRELFGGGHGEMTLLEAEDVLEAGIEVVAQPPGKRLQNILLLSGGEKAMTAIALVMAIFRYRPSPFCLLDEVDAPLDEANVGRFVTKIAEMAEQTQFIVITHNKRTMEAARALYGVTMQEAGVSRVVSVRFE